MRPATAARDRPGRPCGLLEICGSFRQLSRTGGGHQGDDGDKAEGKSRTAGSHVRLLRYPLNDTTSFSCNARTRETDAGRPGTPDGLWTRGRWTLDAGLTLSPPSVILSSSLFNAALRDRKEEHMPRLPWLS